LATGAHLKCVKPTESVAVALGAMMAFAVIALAASVIPTCFDKLFQFTHALSLYNVFRNVKRDRITLK
jgi:hypothetical protein